MGDSSVGGNSTSVSQSLVNVTNIFHFRRLCCSKKRRSMVSWGREDVKASEKAAQALTLRDHHKSYAFAAIKNDGSLVTWGMSEAMLIRTATNPNLTNIKR